jgi:hypothetical protein
MSSLFLYRIAKVGDEGAMRDLLKAYSDEIAAHNKLDVEVTISRYVSNTASSLCRLSGHALAVTTTIEQNPLSSLHQYSTRRQHLKEAAPTQPRFPMTWH